MIVRPVAGIAAGVLFGVAYWRVIGCTTGSCWISSDPFLSGGYWGLAGFFVGGGIQWVRRARQALGL